MTPEQERQRTALRAYTRMPDFAVMPFLLALLADLDAAEARAERAEADADELRRHGGHSDDCTTMAQCLGSMRCRCGWEKALAAHDEAVKQRP